MKIMKELVRFFLWIGIGMLICGNYIGIGGIIIGLILRKIRK